MTSGANTQLERTYHRRFDGDLEYRTAVWKVLSRDFFSRYVQPNDRILDLGCGYGLFINQIECAQRYAMDLNPAARQHLRNDVVFLEQDCAERWPISDNTLDLVFTSNFLEHLPDKNRLTRTLTEAYRCLRVGGLLIAMGPNVKYIPGPYWDFFDHHIPLTELSLREALEVEGFRSREMVGRFLPYTMVNTRRYPLPVISFYLKARWLWRWFGAQFLVVVEK